MGGNVSRLAQQYGTKALGFGKTVLKAPAFAQGLGKLTNHWANNKSLGGFVRSGLNYATTHLNPALAKSGGRKPGPNTSLTDVFSSEIADAMKYGKGIANKTLETVTNKAKDYVNNFAAKGASALNKAPAVTQAGKRNYEQMIKGNNNVKTKQDLPFLK